MLDRNDALAVRQIFGMDVVFLGLQLGWRGREDVYQNILSNSYNLYLISFFFLAGKVKLVENGSVLLEWNTVEM